MGTFVKHKIFGLTQGRCLSSTAYTVESHSGNSCLSPKTGVEVEVRAALGLFQISKLRFGAMDGITVEPWSLVVALKFRYGCGGCDVNRPKVIGREDQIYVHI